MRISRYPADTRAGRTNTMIAIAASTANAGKEPRFGDAKREAQHLSAGSFIQYVARPPHRSNTDAVLNAQSSELSQRISDAASCGRRKRFIGIFDSM